MRIGIDLDGVVIDSEATFRVYEEIYDIEHLKGNNLINIEEPKFQGRYNWTDNEQKNFINKYFMEVSKNSNLMPGFKKVYEFLKKEGHTLIVITARGSYIKEMKDDALRLLGENNIVFDKYYWNVSNKVEICKKEKIDLMIDDDYKIIKDLSNNNINTLYFKDTNLYEFNKNKYIHEVTNWGDIYRYIKNINKEANVSEIIYNKLVRDKIPEIIKNNNEKACTRILDDKEYKNELFKKLKEECKEIVNTTNSLDLLEEIADVLEVVYAILNLENKTIDEVETIRKTKNLKRGGFEERIFLEKN